MRNKLPLFWVRLLYYEYWPYWIFFLPLVPYWLYLSLRARSFTYFTAANPGIEHGGVFGESKRQILAKIDKKYLPRAIFCKQSECWAVVEQRLIDEGLNYPVIAKPDVGERGSQVVKIESDSALQQYLKEAGEPFIVQEFIDYPLELGILYYRLPISGKSGITSIVRKEFLTVQGNGKSTLSELIKTNERAHLQWKTLSLRFFSRLSEVIPEGEKILLEPIGNHCKATKFLSAQHLINARLVEVFDRISASIEGFCFGRFDLKVASVEALQKGEQIRILELNGVTSEPGHIYDPSLNLWRAYRDTARHMRVMFRVSQENRQLGQPVTPLPELVRLLRKHFGGKRVAEVAMSNQKLSNALGGTQ